jgi:hypothetical protein
MNLKEALMPKNIILNAIKDKMEGTGVIKISMIFNVLTDKYTVIITDKDNKKTKIPLESNEINMIKKVFISRIVRKYQEQTNVFDVLRSVIIQIGLNESLLEVFIENTEGTVEKFNY